MAPPETARAAPAIAGSDPRKTSLLGGFDGSQSSKISPSAQEVCRDLIRQDIADQIEHHIAQLDAAVSMLAASSDAGFLHGLRRAQAFWNSIKSAAGELASQSEAGQ